MKRTERLVTVVVNDITGRIEHLKKRSRPGTRNEYSNRIKELKFCQSALKSIIDAIPKRAYFDRFGYKSEDGEFVLSPIEQEDGSISYWIAQKGYRLAMYCFTIGHGGATYEEQMRSMPEYINIYLKQLMK